MQIEIKGYKVVHGSYAYKGLIADTLWGAEDEIKDGKIYYPERLIVTFVDHDGKIGSIEDFSKNFAFLKE